MALTLLVVGCAGQTGSSATAANDETAPVPAEGERAVRQAPTQVQTNATREVAADPLSRRAHNEPPASLKAELQAPANGANDVNRANGALAGGQPETAAHRGVTVPAGTALEIEIQSDVSSKTSAVGDPVTSRVATAVTHDGEVVIPAGATLIGSVAEANSADRFGGISSLALRFDSVELADGRRVPVQATFRQEVRGEKKKDAATIGGAAVGGAILGRVLKDGDRAEGTKQGAIAGAAIGTAVAAATKGKEVEMPAGTTIQVQLDSPATF